MPIRVDKAVYRDKRIFGKYVPSDMGVQLECKRAKTQIETDVPGMRGEMGTTEAEGDGV